MRPNKIGYVLVAFFLLGGIGFWIAIPAASPFGHRAESSEASASGSGRSRCN